MDYTTIEKKYHINSYIKNYNKRIKKKLLKYLFDKNKTKISWPLFNYFIFQEENDYRNGNIKKEFKLENKNIFYNLINNNDNINNENNEDEIEIEDNINNSINKT